MSNLKFLSAKEKYKKAVCLIPRATVNNLICHEYDFCKCDVDELLKEARKQVLREVIKILEHRISLELEDKIKALGEKDE